MLYAFTAAHPLKAAAELREAGYDAFCLMMLDRRRQHRHRAKGPASFKPKPVIALAGYVFAHDADVWKCSKMRHVGQPVKFAGKVRPIPAKEVEWLSNPPSGLFHDTQIPRFKNRPVPPPVKIGDKVRFVFACEQVEAPVISVDGHTLILRIAMLGRDTVRVPLEMVETVAA